MRKERKPFIRLSVLGGPERHLLTAALVKLLEKPPLCGDRKFSCMVNGCNCGEPTHIEKILSEIRDTPKVIK